MATHILYSWKGTGARKAHKTSEAFYISLFHFVMVHTVITSFILIRAPPIQKKQNEGASRVVYSSTLLWS